MKTQPVSYRASDRQQKIQRTSLYIFNYDGQLFHLTNYDKDIVVTGLPGDKGTDPQTFTACGIQNDALEQSTELNAPKLNVTVGINDSAASQELRKQFLIAATKRLDLTIIQVSSNALPGPIVWGTDLFVSFRGVKTNNAFGDYAITLAFMNLMLQEDGKVPRFYWQKICQHAFGSPIGCRLDLETASYSMTVLVTAVDRINRFVEIAQTQINGVAIAGEINFQGGKLKEFDGSLNLVATIGLISDEAVVPGPGRRLYLLFWSPTLAVGTTIKVYRGCRRTVAACTVNNNLANYGGMPYIPDSNPAVDGIAS